MLEPIADNVMLEIVTRLDELKKQSSILLQDAVRQGEPDRGRVLGIGPAVEDPGYKVGDLVIFHTKEVFQGMKYEGKDLVFVRQDEIMGIITEES